jgi:hypothetical protein
MSSFSKCFAALLIALFLIAMVALQQIAVDAKLSDSPN